jgi:hypothetical protein
MVHFLSESAGGLGEEVQHFKAVSSGWGPLEGGFQRPKRLTWTSVGSLGQYPGVDLPPFEEQEPVEMHSPAGPLAPTVHSLFESEGGFGEEVQHFKAISLFYTTEQMQRGLRRTWTSVGSLGQ